MISLVQFLKWLLSKLTKPGDIYVLILTEANGMLRVKVLFPINTDRDTVKRLFTYSYEGSPKVEMPIPANQPDLVFDVPEDAHVTLELFNVDNAGNKSEPSVFDFVAVDTIPPRAPGQMGVQVIDEIPDPVEGGDPESNSEEDDSETDTELSTDEDDE